MRRAFIFLFLCACSDNSNGTCDKIPQNAQSCPATFATSYAGQACSPIGVICEYPGTASCTSNLVCTDAGTWTFSQ